MTSFTKFAAVSALAAFVYAGPAQAEDLDFLLINASSADIIEFQVSDPGDDYWTDNLIPSGYVLPAGNEIEVLIADGQSNCNYDIRAVWDDGSEYVEYDSDLCDLGEWEFTD
ncbi:hypothetical protein [Pyruvatibacter sp. HU-CL02332]|uniref:hypothetical protein n=1 Tax=Pyruvatibacter sp. HU-CL02332 TaxID=3127650 RepID=UPI00296A6155|nr:hypothetical protein [Alphaproteobacteria bacterium]